MKRKTKSAPETEEKAELKGLRKLEKVHKEFQMTHYLLKNVSSFIPI